MIKEEHIEKEKLSAVRRPFTTQQYMLEIIKFLSQYELITVIQYLNQYYYKQLVPGLL